MHNHTGFKKPKSIKKTVKPKYSSMVQNENETRDDQEQGMISKKSIQEISKISHTKLAKNKYYHIINPNLDQSKYPKEESLWGNFRQLTLKNLIIFLVLLFLLMFGAYKIIQQIYQIQHPQKNQSIKMNQKRISMQKEGSLTQKQQMKAQKSKELRKVQTPQKLDLSPNRLEMAEKRFKESIEKNQMIRTKKEINTQLNHGVQEKLRENFLPQAPSSQQSKGSTQDIDSVLKQKEKDIETLQNPHPLSTQIFIESKDQQPTHPFGGIPKQNSIPTAHSIQTRIQNNNPVIQNSAQYLWYSSGASPIPKANITKQQAIKWKDYVKMIEIPLNTAYQNDRLLKEEYEYFEKKYQISQYTELPICVVVPSFNNAENNRYKLNIQSILQQNYSNYHVVFIDDKSDDHTGEFVKDYLSYFQPKYRDKVKVIINDERKMAMPNLRYAAMHQCQENQLFIIIDGDDSLIGRQVFKLFSAVMQKKDLWVMWTNFLSPKGSIGYSRQYPLVHRNSNNYRRAGFVMSHLRAYYTKLFRLIKEEDLKDENGDYFHAANDVAIGIPILEMAHLHTGYVPEISYFYNMNTGLNNHRVRLKQQKNNDKKIRKKPKYEALTSLNFDVDQKFSPQSTAQQSFELQNKNPAQSMGPLKQLDINQMEYMLHQKINQVYLQSSEETYV